MKLRPHWIIIGVQSYSLVAMLQASANRIDRENGAYDDENVQITHLACNLAKNKYGAGQFLEWLDTVRGEDIEPEGEI